MLQSLTRNLILVEDESDNEPIVEAFWLIDCCPIDRVEWTLLPRH